VAKLLSHAGPKTLKRAGNTDQLHRKNLVKKPKAILIFLWSTFTRLDPSPHLELEILGYDNEHGRGGKLQIGIEGPLS
jgi:hypothetical protein